jgi:sugar phosphate isomerase/epimerase
MKQSQLGINTVSVSGELPDILEACGAGGFKNVEFFLGQVKGYLSQGHTLGEVGDLLRRYDLRCIGGFETGLEAFAEAEAQAANHAHIVQNARLLAELGDGTPQNLVVGTGSVGDLDSTLERYAEAVASVAGQMQPLGVNLLIEFNWGGVKTLTSAAQIVSQSGASNAGVLFDPAHYHCTPTKFEDLTPENVATIKHVHVNNMRRKPAEFSNCNDDRLLPDDPQGALDLAALFGRIEQNGYTGLFAIEMFSQQLWAMPAKDAVAELHRSCLASGLFR